MAQPTPYTRQYNFSNYQAFSPTAPLPAQEVDAEFNALAVTAAETLANLALIQRDDGALADGIVTVDSLDPELSIGFTFRGGWALTTAYVVGDGVAYAGKFYRANVAHTSTALRRPDLSPADWTLLVDLSTAVALSPGAVGTSTLADGAVTSAKILDGTIVDADLSAGAGIALTKLGSFTQTGTGAVARPVIAKFRDIVAAGDFGAVGDGVADDTAAVQAALNTGRAVLAPKGTYKLTSPLTVTVANTGLIGEGKGTVFAPGAGTSDIFSLGDGTNEISGLRFENFTIWPSATRTGGHAFNCRFVTDSLWNNVRTGSIDDYVANGNAHRLWHGFYFDRFSQLAIEGGEIVVATDALKTRGNADQSFGAELSLDGGLRIFKAGGKGVWIGGACGGVYLGRMDISECRYGLYVDSTLQAGIPNREVFLGSFCTIDTCTGWGINLEATSLAFLETNGVWVSGCGSAGTGEGGVRVAPSAGVQAKWGNLRVQSSYYDGVSLNDGAHSFSGGFIKSNGTGASGGHGLLIAGSGVSNCSVDGILIHNNGSGARGNGISVGVGADNYTITNNRFFSNGAAAVADANAPSTTRVVRDNSGWVTENSGYATVLSGNTTVVVSHGLADTPTSVVLTPASALDAGAYAYAAPADFTSTQFTIRYSAVAASNRAFAWRATRGSA